MCGFLRGFLLLRNQNYPGSESRARMPVLVQVGLDSAYFQTQHKEQPSCGLQARVGPARSGLAFAAPRGRVPSGNGASVPLSLAAAAVCTVVAACTLAAACTVAAAATCTTAATYTAACGMHSGMHSGMHRGNVAQDSSSEGSGGVHRSSGMHLGTRVAAVACTAAVASACTAVGTNTGVAVAVACASVAAHKAAAAGAAAACTGAVA